MKSNEKTTDKMNRHFRIQQGHHKTFFANKEHEKKNDNNKHFTT